MSIIIPTKNGERTIGHCLRSIHSQKTNYQFEIIAVDSGSTDSTLQILRQYEVECIRIQKFSHGRSRNLGADLSKGKFLIFINQDAIPANNRWLENLMSPLSDSRTVASYSRQIPYDDIHPAERHFILRTYPPNPRIHTVKDLSNRDPTGIVLFSTVSGTIRKDVWSRYRFAEDIIMSEDQEIAVRLLRSGWNIAYQPESIVVHSHQYKVKDYFKRYFDSGYSMTIIPELSNLDIVKSINYIVLLMKETIMVSKPFGIKFSIRGIIYVLAKISGFLLGMYAEKLPTSIRMRLSHTRAHAAR